jgi:hypothetical protein
VTPEVLAEAGRWMHEAQSRATNAIVKRRLAGLNAHLRFAERGREVYDRVQAAARQRNPAELERAKTLAAQAHRELEAAREADPQAVILSFEVNPFDRLLRERDPR